MSGTISHEGPLLHSAKALFPGVSASIAVFLFAIIIFLFIGAFGVGLFCAYRFVRTSSQNHVQLKPTIRTRSQQLVFTQTSASSNVVNSVDEIKITTESDIEAAKVEVERISEMEMIAKMPEAVREAYLKLIGQYQPPQPVQPMFPEGPRRKCKELKDSYCESGCFCKSTWGEIAGCGNRKSTSSTSSLGVLPIHVPLSHSNAPVNVNYYRYRPTSDASIYGSAPYNSNYDYNVTPVAAVYRPDSAYTRNACNSSRTSTSSNFSFSDSESIVTPKTPTLFIQDVTVHQGDSLSSSTDSPVIEDTNKVQVQTTPSPALKQQQRASASGMRPLLLVNKVVSQPKSQGITNKTEDVSTSSRKVLGDITNTNKRSSLGYKVHDTTVSRVVKIGGGKRHRNSRPSTLGY